MRYKDCCGILGGGRAPAEPRSVPALMSAALVAQQARQLDDAERLYRSALSHAPDLPDALHMLGVIRYEKDDNDEARSLIIRALELTNWAYPAYRHNLGLVIARANAAGDDVRCRQARARYRQWREARTLRPSASQPRVDVVVPCFNHHRFIVQALRSVFCQTYRNIEVIVVDDGSSDGSADLAARTLQDSPFPHRFVARANRGAAPTINEGIGMGHGEFINVLNSDDLFAPDRIETMVDAIAARDIEWGFSAVSFIDEREVPLDTLQDARVYSQACSISAIPFRETVGFSLVASNTAVSSGNLFLSRPLFERVGGFRNFRYNHDWDFCLRAIRLAEPAFVSAETYRYRLHAANTIGESREGTRDEANLMMSDFLAWAMTEDPAGSSLAPSLANWGTPFLVSVLESGMGELVDPALLRQLAAGALALGQHDSAQARA
jgi:hypothetical protein